MKRASGRIYLMGVKHAGKSTLGKRLAARLGCRFIDLDDGIMELFSRQRRQPVTTIREVYRALGAQGFLQLELEAARGVVAQPAAGDASEVVALGGGIIENPAAMACLDGSGLFVYLLQDEEVLYQRIVARGIPPFLDSADPLGSFGALFRRRDALYRQYADRVADIRQLSPAHSLDVVVRTIEE